MIISGYNLFVSSWILLLFKFMNSMNQLKVTLDVSKFYFSVAAENEDRAGLSSLPVFLQLRHPRLFKLSSAETFDNSDLFVCRRARIKWRPLLRM